MPTPFVKICGLSTPESVDCAVSHGADAVGFVFAESVRRVSAAHAQELIKRIPDAIVHEDAIQGGAVDAGASCREARVETVGVFRAQPIDEVIAIAKAAGVSTIQFHGFEPYEDLQRAHDEGFRTMRAFGVDEFAKLSVEDRQIWQSERLLIDAVEPGGGVPFDPAQLNRGTPDGWWLLAGGLNAENVAALIEKLQPAGVDVSSGVESSRGVKSLDRIAAFIAAAKGEPAPKR